MCDKSTAFALLLSLAIAPNLVGSAQSDAGMKSLLLESESHALSQLFRMLSALTEQQKPSVMSVAGGAASATSITVQDLFPEYVERDYQATFVLPIYKTSDGKEWVILGRERGGRDKGTWCMFGGSKSKSHPEPILTCAAREFIEEGLVGDCLGWTEDRLVRFLDPRSAQSKIRKIIIDYRCTSRARNIFFVIDISKDDADTIFAKYMKVRADYEKKGKYTYTEMNRIGFVSYENLCRAVSDGSLTATVHDRVTKQKSTCDLRPLLQSLRLLCFDDVKKTELSPFVWLYERGC